MNPGQGAGTITQGRYRFCLQEKTRASKFPVLKVSHRGWQTQGPPPPGTLSHPLCSTDMLSGLLPGVRWQWDFSAFFAGSLPIAGPSPYCFWCSRGFGHCLCEADWQAHSVDLDCSRSLGLLPLFLWAVPNSHSFLCGCPGPAILYPTAFYWPSLSHPNFLIIHRESSCQFRSTATNTCNICQLPDDK